MTVEALKAAAKSDAARKHKLRFRIRTGWAMHGNVRCAFYPDCHRWAYFVAGTGKVNRADVEPLLGSRL